MKHLAYTCAALAAAAGGCGPEPVTLPTPPMQAETAALVAAYDAPTGVIDMTKIKDTLDRAEARLEELQLDWLPDLLSEALARLDQRLQDNGLTTDPAAVTDNDRPIIDAYATIHRICRGWDDPPGPPDEAANGSIEVTAVVEDGVLRRDAWGEASNCRARVLPAGKPVFDGFLNGTVILHLEGALTQNVSTARFLFYMTGTVGVATRMSTGSFDFRFVEGKIEYRLQQPEGGEVVILVGVTTLGVRDRNATYSCDLIAQTCAQTGEAP